MTTKHPPRRRPSSSSSIRPDLNRIEAATAPWWTAAPSVAGACINAVLMPVKWIVIAADAVVALTFVAFGAIVWMWWTGAISDATAAEFIGKIGERCLGILKSSGWIP